jgi:4-amino-4-deoxy-L-arabinose transferase-like glycosyltransferase
MNKMLFTKYVPAGLLSLLFIISLILTFQQARTYGIITVDEQLQDQYGQLTLNWYKTGGKDQSFMTAFYPPTYMPEHGPVIETIIAEVQHKVGHPLYTRALMVGLMGIAGILAIALCGFELGGWWGALLAASGLLLYPRFIGTIFNNSKDVPFASSMTFMLWLILLLTRQWGRKWHFLFHSLLIGILLGFATSIRITAILWLPLLACLPIGWWLYYGRQAFKERTVLHNLSKQIVAASIILLATFIVMYICWPFFAMNPIHNFYKAFIINSRYPWRGQIIFDGQLAYAANLSRSYIPTWLFIGSPPALIFLAIIGTLLLVWKCIKRQVIELQIAVIALTFFFPLIALLIQRPVLYNALRQFLFIVPPLILISVYGFMQMFNYLKQRKQKAAMIALVLIVGGSQLLVIKDMADLYPYQYVYFSPLVGGYSANVGKYEIDYEGLCLKPATDWLALNYKHYTTKAQPSIRTTAGSAYVTPYYPTLFKGGDKNKNPDFYIYFAPSAPDTNFPNYKTIHTVSLEGYPLCTVKAR